MYKPPKIVLVFEPTPEQGKTYSGILESSGFLVKVVYSEVDFYEECIHILPDVIVLNSTHEQVNEEIICKRLQKHKFLKMVPVIILVEKIGFNTTTKAKQLGVELEVFPLINNQFLQIVKKISKKVVLPQVEPENNNILRSEVNIELEDISEMHISFIAPVKLSEQGRVLLSSELLESLGILENIFIATSKGVMHETKQYKNILSLKGLSVDVHRDLKKYLASNREK
ncbi:MAG: CheY-like chemotaxis protein [Bacteriovoracaceae bacterium]|jgi:CheY-like chemotaxis protein